MRKFKARPTILLIDDDQAVLSVGTLMIQRFGYKVLQATSGMEANQIFQNYRDDISLVILDENISDELGSDICKRIKGFEPHVKILHTSGLGKVQGENGFDCGCEAFLPKPFRIDELSNRLKIMLEKT